MLDAFNICVVMAAVSVRTPTLRHVSVPSRELDELLTQYFLTWKPYSAILKRLQVIHGVFRSIKWLKVQFSRLNLRRRSRDPSHQEICLKIKEILTTSDGIRGYRSVWKILRDQYGIIVRRDTVMQLLRDIDLDGVISRRKETLKRRTYRTKGPNHVWHLDGYDKLSPYGLTIHGCIDGFSRKLLWLWVCSTNHNPRVIVRHYLDCVKSVGGCPAVLRCDYGTENTSLGTAQIAFRMNHTDSMAREKSFVYGPSKSNIRIEAFWSQLRKSKTSWWIDFCKDLVADGHYAGTEFHRRCLTFSCARILQAELNSFIVHWNGHRIRTSRNADCPGGYPDDLHDMPEMFGAEDCIKEVDEALWIEAYDKESVPPPPFYPDDFKAWATVCLQQLHLSQEQITTTNMKPIYMHLISSL